MISKKHL